VYSIFLQQTYRKSADQVRALWMKGRLFHV